MSSLRPLITITLLALAGVVLYMKINETEPALPAAMEGQEWSAELDVGAGAAAVGQALPPVNEMVAAPLGDNAGDAPGWSPQPLHIGDGPVVDQAALTKHAPPSAAPTGGPAPAVPEMPALPPSSAQPENQLADKSASRAAPVAALATGAAMGAAAASRYDSGPAAMEGAPSAPPFTTVAAEEGPVTPANPFTGDATQASAAPMSGDPGDSSTMFAAAKTAVQGALDRGEFAQALLLLSDWYGEPSLSPTDAEYVDSLLGQLAGSVIYEGPPAHRLEPAYIVQAGETLDDVARRYNLSAPLLAKINGVDPGGPLQPGQELKVVRGPFSALIDLSERRMTLMLERRYAGRFTVEIAPDISIEEGHWKVDQKLLTPAAASLYAQPTDAAAEDRSLILANAASPSMPAAVIRGGGSADPLGGEPRGRVLRLSAADVNDVFDILSVGSRVTIRR